MRELLKIVIGFFVAIQFFIVQSAYSQNPFSGTGNSSGTQNNTFSNNNTQQIVGPDGKLIIPEWVDGSSTDKVLSHMLSTGGRALTDIECLLDGLPIALDSICFQCGGKKPDLLFAKIGITPLLQPIWFGFGTKYNLPTYEHETSKEIDSSKILFDFLVDFNRVVLSELDIPLKLGISGLNSIDIQKKLLVKGAPIILPLLPNIDAVKESSKVDDADKRELNIPKVNLEYKVGNEDEEASPGTALPQLGFFIPAQVNGKNIPIFNKHFNFIANNGCKKTFGEYSSGLFHHMLPTYIPQFTRTFGKKFDTMMNEWDVDPTCGRFDARMVPGIGAIYTQGVGLENNRCFKEGRGSLVPFWWKGADYKKEPYSDAIVNTSRQMWAQYYLQPTSTYDPEHASKHSWLSGNKYKELPKCKPLERPRAEFADANIKENPLAPWEPVSNIRWTNFKGCPVTVDVELNFQSDGFHGGHAVRTSGGLGGLGSSFAGTGGILNGEIDKECTMKGFSTDKESGAGIKLGDNGKYVFNEEHSRFFRGLGWGLDTPCFFFGVAALVNVFMTFGAGTIPGLFGFNLGEGLGGAQDTVAGDNSLGSGIAGATQGGLGGISTGLSNGGGLLGGINGGIIGSTGGGIGNSGLGGGF